MLNCATANVCFNDSSLNPSTGVCQCKPGFKGKVVLVISMNSLMTNSIKNSTRLKGTRIRDIYSKIPFVRYIN